MRWFNTSSLDKMAAISQTIFSDAFSWLKGFVLWSKFHWSLFPNVQLTINQHWFRQWVGAEMINCPSENNLEGPCISVLCLPPVSHLQQLLVLWCAQAITWIMNTAPDHYAAWKSKRLAWFMATNNVYLTRRGMEHRVVIWLMDIAHTVSMRNTAIKTCCHKISQSREASKLVA